MPLFGKSDKSISKGEYTSIALEDSDGALSFESPFVFTDPDMKSTANAKKYSSVFTYSRPASTNQATLNASFQKKLASQDVSSAYSYDSLFGFAGSDTKKAAIMNQYSSVFTYTKPVTGFRTGPDDYVECEADSWTYIFVSSAVLLFSWCVLILTFPATFWYYIKVLPQHERLLLFRLGRIQPLRGPGSVITLPFVDKWQRIDTRVRAFNIPPQQFITADNGVVELGASVHLQVTDMVRSALHVRDLDHATRTLGQTLLVNHLCKKSCSQLEKEKNYINVELQAKQWLLGELSLYNSQWRDDHGSKGALSQSGSQPFAGSNPDHTSSLQSENFNQTSLEWGVEIVRIELSHVNVLKPPNPGSAVGPIVSAFKSMFSPASSHSPTSASADVLQPTAGSSTGLYEQLQQNLQDITASTSLSGMEFLVRLDITGPKASIFGLEVKGGIGRVLQEHEIKSNPDVALSLSEDDLHAIFNHTLTPLQAYICGKLQVQGDVQLLMRLEGLLKTSKDHHPKRSVITV